MKAIPDSKPLLPASNIFHHQLQEVYRYSEFNFCLFCTLENATVFLPLILPKTFQICISESTLNTFPSRDVWACFNTYVDRCAVLFHALHSGARRNEGTRKIPAGVDPGFDKVGCENSYLCCRGGCSPCSQPPLPLVWADPCRGSLYVGSFPSVLKGTSLSLPPCFPACCCCFLCGPRGGEASKLLLPTPAWMHVGWGQQGTVTAAKAAMGMGWVPPPCLVPWEQV